MIKRKTVSQCSTPQYCNGWNDAVAEIEKGFPVNLSYAFKGSLNCYIRIILNDDESLTLVSDYGEAIKTVYSGESLADLMKDLSEGKYS